MPGDARRATWRFIQSSLEVNPPVAMRLTAGLVSNGRGMRWDEPSPSLALTTSLLHRGRPRRYAALQSWSSLGEKGRSRPLGYVLRRELLAVVTAAVLVGSQPTMVSAIGSNCGSLAGYHYAGQITSHTDGFTHCAVSNGYFGWAGVNGQITTPSQNISLPDFTIDHTLGWIGAQFNSDLTWFQTGWFTGTIAADTANCTFLSCVRRNGSYGRYVENISPSGISILDYGTVALGSSTTSRVVYNGSSGCWEVWLTYSGGYVQLDCNEPTSGEMVATSEMLSNSGGFVTLPTAKFGTSNPNTNQALRLLGANGFEPWDTVLLAWYTERFDERFSTPKYVVSHFNAWYYFKAYSQ